MKLNKWTTPAIGALVIGANYGAIKIINSANIIASGGQAILGSLLSVGVFTVGAGLLVVGTVNAVENKIKQKKEQTKEESAGEIKSYISEKEEENVLATELSAKIAVEKMKNKNLTKYEENQIVNEQSAKRAAAKLNKNKEIER